MIMNFKRSSILKCAVYTLLLSLCSLIQVTFAARLRPFGTIPDFLIAATISIALFEDEKFASMFGLIFGIVIETLGYSGMGILPLFYMACGAVVGLCFKHIFSRSFLAWYMYVALSLFLHGIITIFAAYAAWSGMTFGVAFLSIFLPQFLVSLAIAPLFYLIIAKLSKKLSRNY